MSSIYGSPKPQVLLQRSLDEEGGIDNLQNVLYPDEDFLVSVADVKAAERYIATNIEPAMVGVVTSFRRLIGHDSGFTLQYNANVPVAATLYEKTVLFFNPTHVAESAVRDIVEDTGYYKSHILGLLSHEIGHVVLQNGHGLSSASMKPKHQTFNILEDMLLEDVMVEKYPITEMWMAAAVSHQFSSSNANMLLNYPVLAGRSLASKELQEATREAWVAVNGEESASRIEELAVLYKTKDWKKDRDELVQIVDEFHQLLGNNPPECCNGNSRDEGDGSSASETSSDGKEEEKSAEGLTDILQKGQTNSDEKQEMEENIPQDIVDRIAEAIENMEAEVREATSSQNPVYDVDTGEQETESDIGTLKIPPKQLRTTFEEARPADYRISQDSEYYAAAAYFDKAKREIERLLNEKRAVKYNRKKGEFNIRSAVKSGFRSKWVDGKQYRQIKHADMGHGRIEIVIALDNSGSMRGGPAIIMYRSAAHLKRILDDLGLSVTVLSWSDSCQVLYGREEKADRQTYRDGGIMGLTEPEVAESVAVDLFETSDMPYKIFFIMTDGGWSDYDGRVLQKIKDLDVSTYLVIYQYENFDTKHYDTIFWTDDIEDIAESIILAVKSTLQGSKARW